MARDTGILRIYSFGVLTCSLVLVLFTTFVLLPRFKVINPDSDTEIPEIQADDINSEAMTSIGEKDLTDSPGQNGQQEVEVIH